MIDALAINAALTSASDPQKVLSELDDEELGDLHEDAEDPRIRAMLDEELRRRRRTGGRSWTGLVVWIVVIAMVVGSIAAVVLR